MSGDILTIRRTCLVRQHQKDRRSWRECILSILRKSGNAHVGGELAQHSLLTMVGRYIEVEEREVSTVGLSATAGVIYGDSRQMRSVAGCTYCSCSHWVRIEGKMKQGDADYLRRWLVRHPRSMSTSL